MGSRFPVLSYIAAASLLFPVFTGTVRRTRIDASVKLIFWFFVADAVLTGVSISMSFQGIKNLWLIQIDTVLRSTTFLCAYAMWEQNEASKKRLIGLWLVFVVFWLLMTTIGGTFFEYDSVTRSTCKAMLALTSAYYIYKTATTEEVSMLENPRFWILLGTATYCGGSTLLSSIGASLIKSRELTDLVWPINWVLTIGTNIFYARAFLCRSQT